MKNGVYSEFKVFAGNGNRPLAEEIAKLMGGNLGIADVKKFSDGEVAVNIQESVRGKDCYIVQSTSEPTNDNLMELLIMTDAMRRASAGRINAVIPYYGYGRQDRTAKARDPITARLVADLLQTAGVDRVITMDLHASQIQGFFTIPVDHLLGGPILQKYFASKKIEDLVVVSPDHGSVTRARNFAQPLNAPIAIIDKRRPRPNVSEIMNFSDWGNNTSIRSMFKSTPAKTSGLIMLQYVDGVLYIWLDHSDSAATKLNKTCTDYSNLDVAGVIYVN